MYVSKEVDTLPLVVHLYLTRELWPVKCYTIYGLVKSYTCLYGLLTSSVLVCSVPGFDVAEGL